MDMNELVKKAKEVQDKIQQSKEQLAELKVVGKAGIEPNTVKVVMNGHYEAKKVTIDSSLVAHPTAENLEILEDLVAAAINDAVHKIGETSKNTLLGALGNMQLPEGFKWPV